MSRIPPGSPEPSPEARSTRTAASFPPAALRSVIAESLTERWQEVLEPDQFFQVEGEAQPSGYVLFRVSVGRVGQTRRYAVEVGAELRPSATPEDELDWLMDAADAILGTHLEGGRPSVTGVEWSRAWFQGRELAARAGFSDPALEQVADALLGEPQAMPPHAVNFAPPGGSEEQEESS